MKYSRIFLFIRGCILQIKSEQEQNGFNSWRGVFSSTSLFLIASVFVHSYTESLYTEAEMFPENSIMITGNLSEDIYTDVQLNYGSVNYNIYYSPITTNGETYKWNNKNFH